MIRTQKLMLPEHCWLHRFHFDFDISCKKVWKESAENPAVWISGITESDSSFKYWSCPHLTSSSFILFPLKCLLCMIISNITFIFIWLTQIHMKLKKCIRDMTSMRWNIHTEGILNAAKLFLICCDGVTCKVFGEKQYVLMLYPTKERPSRFVWQHIEALGQFGVTVNQK